MSTTELAQESLEQTEHAAHSVGETFARWAAVLIGILAATLAIAEMQEKQAENAYLTHHISISDIWAEYQGKSVRAALATNIATVLESLPGSADNPAIRDRIEAAHKTAEHMRSETAANPGMEQLAEQAKDLSEQRDHQLHRYHGFELVSGLLQLAIVISSVSVVTKLKGLTFVGAALGLGAALYGLMVAGVFG